MTMTAGAPTPEDDPQEATETELSFTVVLDPDVYWALIGAAEKLGDEVSSLASEILKGWLKEVSGEQPDGGTFPEDSDDKTDPTPEPFPEGSSICQECDRVFTPADSPDPVDSLRRHGAALGHRTGTEGGD